MGLALIFISYLMNNHIFRTGGFFTSFLFLLFGLYSGRALYKSQPGIILNPQWAMKTGDGINVLFLGFAAYCLWAWGYDLLFGQKIYLYDREQMAINMTALFYFPTVLILAFFMSNFANQSIEIKSNGVVLHYPGKTIRASWEDIISLNLSNTFTVVGGEGWVAPRHFQSKLSIKTKMGNYGIYEPGVKRIKVQIIKILQKNAPERLQKDISILDQDW